MRKRLDIRTGAGLARLLLLLVAAAVVLDGCAAVRRARMGAAVRDARESPLPAAPPVAGAATDAPAASAPVAQPGREPLQAHRAGEQVALDRCLRFAVLDFTDRSGALSPADWVTVRVSNACDEPVRHLRVDLLLLDVAGRTYGTPLWVLERGEVLWPGQGKTQRYAVPDPAQHMPRQWAVRLRQVERPSDRDGSAPQARR